jgi:heat shock protein HslJ
MKILQLTAILILGIFSGCSIVNQASDHVNLGDSEWKLVSIEQTPTNLGENAIIKFNEKESKVSGIAACNSFGANYEMIRQAIKFESLITTKKFCEEKMDEENQIITNLQNVTRYEVKSNILYFYSQDKLMLTYKR